VSVRSQGSLTGITVEDRGAGITKQEQRDVFRKFVRGTAAHTLNVKGTGIGLAMVDQIVKAHGGRLELLSEPGRGSRFTMWLPETKDREARDVGAVLSGRAGGSPRGASGGGAPRATRK
jgi:two-component system phosphate regulon sensor histidine kinase PhoR